MKLAGVGDNVVDRYRDLGTMFPGGQAVNVAVYARRCGLQAAYVGALGDDVAGRHVLAALRAEAIDLSHARVLPGPNAYAEVEVVDGNRVFVGGFKGVSDFHLEPADLEYLRGFDLVHVSESSFLEDQLADIAAVAPLSFDFSERPPSYCEPILPHAAIAEFSLSHLDEREAEEWLVHAHGLGPRLVLATRGGAGAILYDGERFRRQSAVATEVIDTLGAGDAFIARFLVGVVRREAHEVSLSEAAALASVTCGAYGAFGYGTAAFPPVVPSVRAPGEASAQASGR